MSDSTWIPSPGTVLEGRYRIGEPFDGGGMGVILRATHLTLNRDVAVKLLRPDIARDPHLLARFRREVSVAASLNHPNIVQCHDSGETPDGSLFLVMEMLEGCSLKELLAQEERLDLRRAVGLARQMLDGLATAHAQNVIHRDLKPGNLFLATDVRGREVLKILDFGLARSILSEDVKITKTGTICGTMSYLSPESLLISEAAPTIDVYACGLIMLEMVTGRRAFPSSEVSQAFVQHLSLPARIPRRIWDTPYGQLIADCLRKDPAQRPANAEQMLQQLSAVPHPFEPIRLTTEEIPPFPSNRLDYQLLVDLVNGRDLGPELLRNFPAPEPFDAGEPLPDDRAIQDRIVRDVTRSTVLQGPGVSAHAGTQSRIREFEFEGSSEVPAPALDESARRAYSGPLQPPRPGAERRRKHQRLLVLLAPLAIIVALTALAARSWEREPPRPEPEATIMQLPPSVLAPGVHEAEAAHEDADAGESDTGNSATTPSTPAAPVSRTKRKLVIDKPPRESSSSDTLDELERKLRKALR